MELVNFGGVLGFAADLEAADEEFYAAVAANPGLSAHKAELEGLAKQCQKNRKNLLRTRQENVTEMILEPITDFSSEPYEGDRAGAGELGPEQAAARAAELEAKVAAFYEKAADKLAALPEVSRILAKTGKARARTWARSKLAES